MFRRGVLHWLAAGLGAAAGCAGPVVEVTERPTGEIDVAFRTEADRSHRVRLRLEDADGRLVDELDSEFPPDHTPGPSFYGGGLSRGPYAVTIETDVDRTSFEWSVVDCPRLDVTVTVLADGSLEVDRACSAVTRSEEHRTARRTAS